MVSKETKMIAKVGVLSALAIILQYIGTLMGIKVGGFLDVEISDYPAILAAFSMGPAAGLMTELIKNLIHLFVSSTNGIGELANFLINGSLVFAAGLVYKRNKTKKGAYKALLFGVLIMVLAGILMNVYVLLPLYVPAWSPQQKLNTVLTLITPFNIVRGLVLSILTIVSYKRLSPLLHK
jgi:riboflavin transporter FmnP